MSVGAVALNEVLGRQTIHPFPARMAAGIALETLSNLRRPAAVLDPMVGSGTILALARANGHKCIGFDVDPLAVLISRVWTRTISVHEVRQTACEVLERAKRIAADIQSRDAYPISSDLETRAFVRYWFDDYARRQLAALSVAISGVTGDSVREVLWCAFSRQIIAKQAGVSLAMDLAHSRPHRVFHRAPRKPFRLFLSAVQRVIAGCVHCGGEGSCAPVASVELGDVRRMPLPDGSIDLVFTSPPYLNAIDYLRCSKFSLVWMGYSIEKLREIRSMSIGAEVKATSGAHNEFVDRLRLRPVLSPRMSGILRRYIQDTDLALREVARVLTPGGRAVYVVGENTIRGTYIPTGRILTRLADSTGLRLVSRRFRNLPSNRRYLPPPGPHRTALDTRIGREIILTFERPAA